MILIIVWALGMKVGAGVLGTGAVAAGFPYRPVLRVRRR